MFKNEEQRKEVYQLLSIAKGGEWHGGLQRFENVSYANMQKVAKTLGEEFLDGCQNFSPTAKEFLETLKPYANDTTFHGYVIAETRDDERVTIEGCLTKKADELIEAFRSADDFTLMEDALYVWWD